MLSSTFTARWPVVALMALAISLSCVDSTLGEPPRGERVTETAPDEGPVAQGAPEKALRASFPAQADVVLAQEAAFVANEQGFVLGAARSTEAGRNLDVELPREGSGAIRFRGASGVEVRVREIGVEGEGKLAERAVAYRRAGGMSYWARGADEARRARL